MTHVNYNTNSQTKSKNSMFRSILYDYSDGYIPVKRTITISPVPAAAQPNSNKKGVVFKICFPIHI